MCELLYHLLVARFVETQKRMPIVIDYEYRKAYGSVSLLGDSERCTYAG